MVTRLTDFAPRPELMQPLRLPCGVTITNRLAKAALDEKMGDGHQAPTLHIARLYERWARGGVGLSISGNVMVDHRALAEPADVVLEDERDLPVFRQLAEAGTVNGTHLWMQLNHPGRQTPRFLSAVPVAPSDLPALKMGGGIFPSSRALLHTEIEDLIERFARSAALARKAGYTGVQIHAAHGYLISQFLSPLSNLRTDLWGGTPEKRRRFLLEIVRAVRWAVGSDFPVSVKLNSADFQRGGFSEEESMGVVCALAAEQLDLLEVSGGTFESAAMYGQGELAQQSESTRMREAYFLEYARKVRKLVKIPLMVTGGFRTGEGMVSALREDALDLIGLGRPLCLEPDLPSRLADGQVDRSLVMTHRIGHRDLDALAESAWYTYQLHRMGKGLEPRPGFSIWGALALAGVETVAGFLSRRSQPVREQRWKASRALAQHSVGVEASAEEGPTGVVHHGGSQDPRRGARRSIWTRVGRYLWEHPRTLGISSALTAASLTLLWLVVE